MSAAQTLVILLAAVAANLPFFTSRLFLVIPPRGGHKGLGWRLLELLVFYCLVGAVAAALESQAHGSRYEQGWAFYAVTLCLFVVLAFPGFIVRYLWKQRSA